MIEATASYHFDDDEMCDDSSTVYSDHDEIPRRYTCCLLRPIIILPILCFIAAAGLLGMSTKGASPFRAIRFTKQQHKKASYSTTGLYGDLTFEEKVALFEQYKSTYDRIYSTPEEETMRFSNFEEFLKLIDERNGDETGTASHGITKFADLTRSEFEENYLSWNYLNDDDIDVETAEVPEYRAASTTQNWANVYTTPIKNQGYCASSWAFSAVSQIESDAVRAGLMLQDDPLSTQQLLSCDDSNDGCRGGSTIKAYQYVQSVGGLETQNKYKYTSYYYYYYEASDECNSSPEDFEVTVSAWYQLPEETDMQNYVLESGPLSVAVHATTWSTYTGGVLSYCGGLSTTHYAQIVGVDTEESYWLVRNSWGSDWGINGYILLELVGTVRCRVDVNDTHSRALHSVCS
jgi:cysteine peptidase B